MFNMLAVVLASVAVIQLAGPQSEIHLIPDGYTAG
jgi:hypothetical protein